MGEAKRRTREAARKPPSLMDLVSRFGAYDLIPPEAWKEFDAAMAAYRADIASGALWETPQGDDPREDEDDHDNDLDDDMPF